MVDRRRWRKYESDKVKQKNLSAYMGWEGIVVGVVGDDSKGIIIMF